MRLLDFHDLVSPLSFFNLVDGFDLGIAPRATLSTPSNLAFNSYDARSFSAVNYASVLFDPRILNEEDDYGDTPETAGQLIVDGPTVSGRINEGSYRDRDWFEFEILEGQSLEFITTGISPSAGNITVFDSNNNAIQGANGGGGTSVFEVYAPGTMAAGTYYLSLRDGVVVDYTVTLRSFIDDVPVDTNDTLILDDPSITVSSDYTRDTDSFLITVDAGTLVQFDVSGFTDETGALTVLTGGGNSERTVLSSDNMGLTAYFAEAGSYAVTFSSRALGQYTLAATTVVDPINASTATTGALPLDGTLISNFFHAPHEENWYKFTATAGDQIELYSSSAIGPLRLLTATGEFISSPAHSNAWTHAFQDSGTYFLSVTAGPSIYFNNGPITTYVTGRIFTDDSPETTDTPNSINIGDPTYLGSIDYSSDFDWISFEVQAGDIVFFDTSESEVENTIFRIVNDAGTFADSSGSAPSTGVLFSESGTYYISIGLDYGSNQIGQFSLTTSYVFDEHGNDASTTSILTVNGANVFGTLQYGGDEDWISFEAVAGQTIVVDPVNVDMTEYGLYIVLPDGFFQTGQYNAQDTKVGIVIPETGTYFLRVVNRGEGIPDYEFSVKTLDNDVVGDDTSTTPLDAFSTLGAIDFRTDEDFFQVDLDAGQEVFFSIWSQSEDAGFNPRINLHYGGGIFAQGSSNSDGYSSIYLQSAPHSGTYHLAVEARTVEIGDYLIRATFYTRGDATDETLNGGDRIDYIYGYGGNDIINGFGAFDVIYGGDGDDQIDGGDGNDALLGDDGADILNGGAGADSIYGRAGADIMNGGEGADFLRYEGSDAGVTVNLSTGFADGGHATGDVFSNFENIRGSSFDDNLTGDSSNNILRGLDGADILTGLAGNDELTGGDGDDLIMGGEGRDIIDGGAGTDVLTGGAGRDRFMVTLDMGSDQITDFDIKEDVIALPEGAFRSFEELLNAVTEHSGYIEIAFDGYGVMRLDGVTLADLSTTHFRQGDDAIDGGNFYRRGIVFDVGDPKYDPNVQTQSFEPLEFDKITGDQADSDFNPQNEASAFINQIRTLSHYPADDVAAVYDKTYFSYEALFDALDGMMG